MDHGICPKVLSEPFVICIVLMRVDTIRIVIIGLNVPASVRLESHYDVPEDRSGSDDVLTYGVEVTRRLAPILFDTYPHLF